MDEMKECVDGKGNVINYIEYYISLEMIWTFRKINRILKIRIFNFLCSTVKINIQEY